MARLTLRRMRQNRAIRELTREVRVHAAQLIQPCFVVEGLAERQSIAGLDGVYRETPDSLLRQIERDLERGMNKILLFTIPDKHSPGHLTPDFAAGQIEALKTRFGDTLWLAVDLCLCSQTPDGHCGVLNDRHDHVLNHATVDILAEHAGVLAAAGADCIAPSDMMDGRVGAIRQRLDELDLDRALIMSYSAKLHSSFYGPFRLAADSAPSGPLTDRASYQIDPARPRDALLSARRDDAEGADILMVKPGLPCLDLLARLSNEIQRPWAVYQTSGEYAALSLAIEAGLMHPVNAYLETWTAFVRAGASMIISYGARHAPEWLA